MHLTEALAENLKDKDATVNALVPSIIDTPQSRAHMPDAEFTRLVTTEHLAGVIALLPSREVQSVMVGG
jgi:NAD(P)-dependent dehydrogenase (short-subunit alcohol dehydrogenase family)